MAVPLNALELALITPLMLIDAPKRELAITKLTPWERQWLVRGLKKLDPRFPS